MFLIITVVVFVVISLLVGAWVLAIKIADDISSGIIRFIDNEKKDINKKRANNTTIGGS